jgi:hypothetical protein
MADTYIELGGSVTSSAGSTTLNPGPLSIGSTVAAVGDIRLGNDTVMLAFRNAANSADVVALASNSSNSLFIGRLATGGSRPGSITADATSTIVMQIAGTNRATLTSSAFVLQGTALTLVNSGGATAGDIRAANATTIMSARNAAGSADLALIATDASDNLFVGTTAAGGSRTANTIIDTTGGVFIRSGGNNRVTASGSIVTINASLAHTGTSVGFYSTSAAVKQTVSGSRGGNAALASLLTALATVGLITDSSSA